MYIRNWGLGNCGTLDTFTIVWTKIIIFNIILKIIDSISNTSLNACLQNMNN